MTRYIWLYFHNTLKIFAILSLRNSSSFSFTQSNFFFLLPLSVFLHSPPLKYILTQDINFKIININYVIYYLKTHWWHINAPEYTVFSVSHRGSHGLALPCIYIFTSCQMSILFWYSQLCEILQPLQILSNSFIGFWWCFSL